MAPRAIASMLYSFQPMPEAAASQFYAQLLLSIKLNMPTGVEAIVCTSASACFYCNGTFDSKLAGPLCVCTVDENRLNELTSLSIFFYASTPYVDRSDLPRIYTCVTCLDKQRHFKVSNLEDFLETFQLEHVGGIVAVGSNKTMHAVTACPTRPLDFLYMLRHKNKTNKIIRLRCPYRRRCEAMRKSMLSSKDHLYKTSACMNLLIEHISMNQIWVNFHTNEDIHFVFGGSLYRAVAHSVLNLVDLYSVFDTLACKKQFSLAPYLPLPYVVKMLYNIIAIGSEKDNNNMVNLLKKAYEIYTQSTCLLWDWSALFPIAGESHGYFWLLFEQSGGGNYDCDPVSDTHSVSCWKLHEKLEGIFSRCFKWYSVYDLPLKSNIGWVSYFVSFQAPIAFSQFSSWEDMCQSYDIVNTDFISVENNKIKMYSLFLTGTLGEDIVVMLL